MDWKSRLTNYGFWVAVASAVLLLLNALKLGINVEQYNEIINAILGILVMLGVISNPTTNNRGFGDDK
ncbi:MAG: phage holin [Bacillota bacterium]|nr:phage holin [Bacillota bacterium]